jgi:peptide/nickel transport system substrate-binding protein/oligopeptide transport system substrate-binding protein
MLKRAALCALFLVVACVAVLPAADTPGDPKIREFVIADIPQKLSLDPLHTFTSFESQFYTAIYEGLVIADPLTLEPEPGVASDWQSSDSGTVWKFNLRPDAEYSNGDKVRAQDFVDSWLRMMDPANNAEYSFLFDVIKGAHAFRTGEEKNRAAVGVKALSPDVLQVELENPAPHFLKLLTHISFLPLHPSLLRTSGWENAKTVIGNGPFVIRSRSDTEILLDKNPAYWDAANVALDKLRVRFMDDANDATDAYITGKVQWVTQSLISSDKLIASDRLEVFPMFGTTYFFFACDQTPWSDWRVRRGLALLVPWEKLRTKDAFFFPSELLIPAIPGYPTVQGIAAQQVDEGKKLLADAGFPNGRGLPALVVKLGKDSDAKKYVETMADAWKAIVGLDVIIKEVDPDSYYEETKKRDYALGISTWIGDYADPLTFLQLWTSGSNLNDARFVDKDYDAAVNDSLSLVDSKKRYRRLADAEQIFLTKAAILPLDHRPAINLINTKSIDGWFSNPLDVHPFKFIKFKGRTTPPGITMAIN